MKKFEFFKKSDIKIKSQVIYELLENYSPQGIANIFYNIFEKNKTSNLFKYTLNKQKNFKYDNLNCQIISFFNVFDTFEIDSFHLSKEAVKDFIWGEDSIEKENLFTEYNYKYIKIGLYNYGNLCVRYNGLVFHEDDIIGVDDESDENTNELEPSNIFLSLVFEILYAKYIHFEKNDMKNKVTQEIMISH